MHRITMQKLAIATAVAVFLATPVHAEVELKAVSSLPTTSPETKFFIEDFVNSLNKRGKGTIQIKFLGGPEVNPPRTALAGLERGLFDVVYGPASYYAGTLPELLSISGSNQPVEVVRSNGGIELLNRFWEKKSGVRILAWLGSATPMHLYLTRKPEITASGPSLTGMKIRSSPTYRALLTDLGGTPVGMKISDIYAGLERGLIQGVAFPRTGIPALGISRMVKYRIDPGFYRMNIVIIGDVDKVDGLPKAARDMLFSSALAHEKASIKMSNDAAVRELGELQKQGMQVIDLPQEGASRYLTKAYDIMWDRIAKDAPENAPQLKAKFYKP